MSADLARPLKKDDRDGLLRCSTKSSKRKIRHPARVQTAKNPVRDLKFSRRMP